MTAPQTHITIGIIIVYAIKPSKVSESVFIQSVASLNRCIYIAIDCMVKSYGDKYWEKINSIETPLVDYSAHRSQAGLTVLICTSFTRS